MVDRARARSGARSGARSDDRGFTLIEVLLALVLGGIIAGSVVAALITALSVANATTAQVADSSDAGAITAFLVRDAQSAGATDPTTGLRDPTLGVTTDASAVAWTDCAQPAAFVVRFSWIDPTAAAGSRVVVYYTLDSATAELTRRICKGGSTADVLLASHLGSAVATCQPSCAANPISVSIAVTGTGARAPLSYRLTASMRGDVQPTPTVINSTSVPLLALGSGASSACPNVTLAGTGAITAIGNVLVDSSCGAAPISGSQSVLRPTGTTSTVAGIVDPFAGRQRPAFTCAAGGTNASVIGASPTRDTVTVYPQKVVVAAGAVVFQPGRYVFCNGLEITGGQVTGTDVLLYLAKGPLLIDAAATADLTGRVTGVEASLLIWVDAVAQTIKIDGGPRVDTLRGVIYAPSSTLQLSTVRAANIGGLVVKALQITGAGAARIGLPLPVMSVSPTAMPPGQVGVAYPTTTLTVAGGLAPYVWSWASATALPPGLSIDAGGRIAGNPTAAGTFTVTATAFDATAAAVSIDYTFTVNAALGATWPALPNGQVGVAYAPTTMTASLGTPPYVWSATGLPAGLTIGASSGTVAGTPTVAGTFTPTVTVADAMGASLNKTYTVTVNAALGATWPALPNGQVGVAYAPTTMTASLGTPPYVWSATGLPAGLTIGASSGTVAGTPTVAGTFTATVTVSDAMGASLNRAYTIVITASPSGCPETFAGWRGEYYSNRTLTAPATVCRDDASINFDWANGAPAAGLPVDNFSVRWTRSVSFPAGSYTFTMGSDDGSRLYIDGTLVLDRWIDQAYPTPQPTVDVVLAAGTHTLVMEHYERSGAARATLGWVANTPASCSAAATGWLGQYYSNIALTGPPSACRDDAAIDLSWGVGPPMVGLPTDDFSVRWTRTQTFTAGTYDFALGTDDGGRLYIDGRLVLDRWVDQGYPTPQPTVRQPLTSGPHTMVVEYYERGGDARASLVITPVSNGVTAVPSVSGDMTFFGEEQITLTNTSEITALKITIRVVRTTGVTRNGQYNTLGNGLITSTSSTSGGFITYTFDLRSNRTIPAGSGLFAAQFDIKGTLHPTSGDTWTVTSTTALGEQTLSGTF